MKNSQIQSCLQVIEREYNVRLLYACESGSRAWGFASEDSDYDVRFIYAHPPDWYLSIDLQHRRDVIELPIDDELDVSGWDLRKALALFRKTNPPLLEWLGSPIVYAQHETLMDEWRELIPKCYSPLACQYHYYKMAKGNYRDYLRGERVRLKKYLYVLRPLLAVKWLERGLGVVPTEFDKLVEGVVASDELKEAIAKLVSAKRGGVELAEGPRRPVLSSFIEQEFERLKQEDFHLPSAACVTATLNEFFRQALETLWAK